MSLESAFGEQTQVGTGVAGRKIGKRLPKSLNDSARTEFMKAKTSLSNLLVLVTLTVFGLFSFPVHRTAGAKFSPAGLANEPEMAVECVAPMSPEPAVMCGDAVEVLASNTNSDSKTSATH